ncbi:hypothetical protein cyc_07933 [Cyclospora cayetanensis]|uniref:Uncharacterized protein n=1 Tax=Cyclospora cayetanensis TaxID=88456 RepID=A0A1D3CX56_9EIME|nr:hypothetical protein cyc_07933 [Cyclospora cayetanensis]
MVEALGRLSFDGRILQSPLEQVGRVLDSQEKEGLLQGYSDDEQEAESQNGQQKKNAPVGPKGLPADFFDNPAEFAAAEAEQQLNATSPQISAAAVPAASSSEEEDDDANEEVLSYEIEEPDETLLQPIIHSEGAASAEQSEDAPQADEALAVAAAAPAVAAVSSDKSNESEAGREVETDSAAGSSFVLSSLELATATDEAHWYNPFSTALHR